MAALLVATLTPLREHYEKLVADPAVLQGIADQGAAKAAQVAGPVYERAARAMGLT